MSAVHILSKSQNRHLNYNFVTSASSRGLFVWTLTDVRTTKNGCNKWDSNSTILKNAAHQSLLKWAPDRDWEDMHLFLQTIVLERDNDFLIVLFHHLKCEKKNCNITGYCNITIAFCWKYLDLCKIMVTFIACECIVQEWKWK